MKYLIIIGVLISGCSADVSKDKSGDQAQLTGENATLKAQLISAQSDLSTCKQFYRLDTTKASVPK